MTNRKRGLDREGENWNFEIVANTMKPYSIRAVRELRALAAQRARTATRIFSTLRLASVFFGVISLVLLYLTICMIPSWLAFFMFLVWMFIWPICPGLWVDAAKQRAKWMRMRQNNLDTATHIEKNYIRNDDYDYDYEDDE